MKRATGLPDEGRKVKPGTARHRKVNRLMALLGVPRTTAFGVLAILWDSVGADKEDGILRGWTADDVAGVVEWQGNAATLLDALTTARWIDQAPNGTLLIHDWPEEGPRHVFQRLARTMKLTGEATDLQARAIVRKRHDAILQGNTAADGGQMPLTAANGCSGAVRSGPGLSGDLGSEA